jgi:hypothetical protein
MTAVTHPRRMNDTFVTIRNGRMRGGPGRSRPPATTHFSINTQPFELHPGAEHAQTASQVGRCASGVPCLNCVECK